MFLNFHALIAKYRAACLVFRTRGVMAVLSIIVDPLCPCVSITDLNRRRRENTDYTRTDQFFSGTCGLVVGDRGEELSSRPIRGRL